MIKHDIEFLKNKDLLLLIKNLSETEKIIICKYFGIQENKIKIKDLCILLNLSRQRASQLLNRAIKRLNNPYDRFSQFIPPLLPKRITYFSKKKHLIKDNNNFYLIDAVTDYDKYTRKDFK